ncbi:hypothetical protein BBAD15_g5879 [Beauveria bassiana D1-5]|uniref:Uncharacterized protein n=1 Tax=Beauveria bassiana D1-5 TaxID=1245745 RepID=A0A0A2VMF1_BEABA|nr:hypothetical protein BBAD15_g5879 [Beauveria bassiana D1-5]
MRYHNLLAGVIAFTSTAAAQFIFPESSSNLQVNQAVQIRWNKANLQEPLSINLVPAGQVIRQDIVLQQVAVNIGNVGVFQWSADQTISAFPKFAMVIVDARSQVVVSQTFAISGLTKQPNQQIDLNNGNAGGTKNNNGNNKQNEKQKVKAKNNDNDKNGNSRVGGNQNDDKKQQNGNGQKDKATDKQQQNNNNNKGSSTLLPLPGLPPKGTPPVPLKPLPGLPPKGASPKGTSPVSLKPLPGLPPKGAPPVSLKPLPNSVESVPISKPAAAVPESSTSPAAPDAGKESSSSPSSTSKPAPAVAEPASVAAPEAKPEPAAAVPSPTAAASEAAKEQPEPAQPAANGFTILQPSAAAAAAAPPAKAVKAVVAAAAAVPESTLKAEALAAGRSFREKTTSEVVFLTALGVQPGQDKTISTAITPRPVNLAASNAGGASGAQETSSPEDAKPTVLSEKSSAERKVPGLALGLLGVAAGVALL